ncbi:hypothetical protein E2C01_079374 [Portunus trituberculatus]|uniref:Uncharacterized protein n=1 Tax=Portunus trituberculatus TaxID=210409 RepID=A0A5B7IR95_PORTR|nr:hypothetical protein [Portunus trituberculatus]
MKESAPENLRIFSRLDLGMAGGKEREETRGRMLGREEEEKEEEKSGRKGLKGKRKCTTV